MEQFGRMRVYSAKELWDDWLRTRKRRTRWRNWVFHRRNLTLTDAIERYPGLSGSGSVAGSDDLLVYAASRSVETVV
jgi:hypothetical protein